MTKELTFADARRHLNDLELCELQYYDSRLRWGEKLTKAQCTRYDRLCAELALRKQKSEETP